MSPARVASRAWRWLLLASAAILGVAARAPSTHAHDWTLEAAAAAAPSSPSSQLLGVAPLPLCYAELAHFALLPASGDAFVNATRIQQPLLDPSQQPAFVALPRSEAEVEAALRCAARHGLQVAVKGGGHSFGAYSRVPAPGFVIAMQRLTDVQLDERSHRVRVSGGARWADVYDAFSHSTNTYQVVGGLCPSVGVIGYSSGGGVGPLARLHGLAADNVLSLRLTLANGSTSLDVSADSEPDLYWAVRGSGGGQFGVVTSLTLQAHLGVPTYTWGTLTFANRTEAVLARMDAYSPDLPRWLNVDAELDGQGSMTLWIFAAQPSDVARRALQPFLDGLEAERAQAPAADNWSSTRDSEPDSESEPPAAAPAPDVVVDLREADCFWEAIQAFAAAKGYSAYSSRPFLLRAYLLPGISAELGALIAEADAAAPAEDQVQCGQSLIQFGGRIADVAANATAFPWRDTQYMLYASCGFSASEPASRTLASAYLAWWADAVAPHAQGSYTNFIDPELADWQRMYFGDNLQRLLDIKRRVNPPDVGPLRFQQEIGSEGQRRATEAHTRQSSEGTLVAAL